MYQREGKSAIKTDLTNIRSLCDVLDQPQNKFKSVHIAGTNGKGSSAHMLASVLQEAGFKTGLYTSPHLRSFTERIKLNGIEIPENEVVEFVDYNFSKINEIQPSFFEITVAMAFWYFAKKNVDVAVVEVGLGGRLDSTNVIMPEVSLITNISLDHTQMLGTSVSSIAFEKAGIIKDEVPVVIGEQLNSSAQVFNKIAREKNAPILYSDKHFVVDENKVWGMNSGESMVLDLNDWPNYQYRNLPGVLTTLEVLRRKEFHISINHIRRGIETFKEGTALKGRWQKLNNEPLTICDTAHNEAGIKVITEEISKIKYGKLFIVWGMVVDKEVEDMLKELPDDAYFYFCRPDIPRGLEAQKIYDIAKGMGLKGEIIVDVNEALKKASSVAGKNDMIFVGGSTFVVAELDNL
jgi:dihydrofolate synthase/folylpolyglutamate synthase